MEASVVDCGSLADVGTRELLKGLNVFVIRMGISRRDQCSPWRERILAFLLQVLLASVPGAARRDMTSPEERKMHVSR